jgi:hypothetical protein
VHLARKAPTESPDQLPAPLRFPYASGTVTRPRQRPEGECSVKSVRLRIKTQGGAVVDAEGHGFDHLGRHASCGLYRAELIEREPLDPRWLRSAGKVHRAGERSERDAHLICGHFQPGVDRFSWHRRYPKRQPTACRHDADVDDIDKPRSGGPKFRL